MLYGDFITKAMGATIVEADNGVFYLEPTWSIILLENNLDPKDISDYETDWPALNDVLKLEVEKRNVINSKKNFVINWLYELITSNIEPTMLEEETNFLEKLIEYAQATKETKSNEDEDWDRFTQS